MIKHEDKSELTRILDRGYYYSLMKTDEGYEIYELLHKRIVYDRENDKIVREYGLV